VQQKRVAATAAQPDPTGQHWGMLLFESLSAGVMAIFVGFAAVTVIVGLYVILVWPLTFWDLGNLHLERYSAWVRPALWSVFGLGSFVGFLCFSGVAFRTKRKVAVPSVPSGPNARPVAKKIVFHPRRPVVAKKNTPIRPV